MYYNQMLQHYEDRQMQMTSLPHYNIHSLVHTQAAPRSFAAINEDTCGLYWSNAGYEKKSTPFLMNI